MGCVYEYDKEHYPVVFSKDLKKNIRLVESDTKLHTIMAFSVMLLKTTLNDILGLRLCRIYGGGEMKECCLFDVLKMMSKIQS